MAENSRRAYGIRSPLHDLSPLPILSTRIPATTDTQFEVSTLWINTSTNQAWFLTSVSAGSATWALASPGASDVDTLTGDGGGAISPAAGNITLAGGTNITSSGAGSTITFNLDAAISLATSVTSPLYTSTAGSDLLITSIAGQDIIMKMGDAAGANKVSFTDTADAEVFAIDSNGGLTTLTALTVAGAFTQTAGIVSISEDNSANAVGIGGGTVARAITIGQGAAAHTVTIGQAAAGAITVDTAAGISLDSAIASNFTVTGAADLTLNSTAGSVIVNGEEAVADAVQILSAAGGIDWNSALQSNIDSSQAAADAIRVTASDAAGGIDIDAGTGGIAVDSTGTISLGATAASDFTVTGAFDLTLASTLGSIVINAEEAAADAIQLTSVAGGIAASVALQMNLASSQAAADAVRINASNAAGGIDIDSGTAGIAIDSTGAISLGSTAASDFTVTGAFDLTLATTLGSLNLTAGEAIVNAIVIDATDAAGGIDIDAGTAGIAADSTGAISLGAAAASDFTVTGAFDLTLTSTAGSVNMVGAEAAADAVLIDASSATGGITLQTGGGDITISATVKEISAEFLEASGDEITSISQSPVMTTAVNTGGVPTGVNGDVNLMYLQQGVLMEQFIIGTQTIIAPRMTTNGLLVSLDLTAAEGVEYNFGATLTNSRHAFTIGTSAAFFIEVGLYINDMDGADPYVIGFRKSEANNAAMANYTDYASIGMLASSSITNVITATELNGAGQTVTDSTDAWGGDGSTNTLKVLVSASGVVTYTLNGAVLSASAAFTFDNTDVVVPYLYFLHSASATAVNITSLKVGFQA